MINKITQNTKNSNKNYQNPPIITRSRVVDNELMLIKYESYPTLYQPSHYSFLHIYQHSLMFVVL